MRIPVPGMVGAVFSGAEQGCFLAGACFHPVPGEPWSPPALQSWPHPEAGPQVNHCELSALTQQGSREGRCVALEHEEGVCKWGLRAAPAPRGAMARDTTDCQPQARQCDAD